MRGALDHPQGLRDIPFWLPSSLRVSALSGICPRRPGDIRSYSFMPFNMEMADHCCFFFNKNFFCWFQSPIDLCHFLSPSLCASLDMAPGEFSGVYLCLSGAHSSPRWSPGGVGWCSRDTPWCCHTPVTAGRAACLLLILFQATKAYVLLLTSLPLLGVYFDLLH